MVITWCVTRIAIRNMRAPVPKWSTWGGGRLGGNYITTLRCVMRSCGQPWTPCRNYTPCGRQSFVSQRAQSTHCQNICIPQRCLNYRHMAVKIDWVFRRFAGTQQYMMPNERDVTLRCAQPPRATHKLTATRPAPKGSWIMMAVIHIP